MKYDDFEELLVLIEHKLDVTELLDLLGMDITDLACRLKDEIEENYQVVKEACE